MWIYQEKPLDDTMVPNDAVGFLYKITHLKSGKWYIGRRMLWTSTTKTVKGKKTKSKKESDWRNYWSSSEEIQKLVELEGESAFKREVLLFAPTKAALTLGEEYLLHVSGALFDNNCYNNNIRAKIYRKWFTKIPTFFNELVFVADKHKIKK